MCQGPSEWCMMLNTGIGASLHIVMIISRTRCTIGVSRPAATLSPCSDISIHHVWYSVVLEQWFPALNRSGP